MKFVHTQITDIYMLRSIVVLSASMQILWRLGLLRNLEPLYILINIQMLFFYSQQTEPQLTKNKPAQLTVNTLKYLKDYKRYIHILNRILDLVSAK